MKLLSIIAAVVTTQHATLAFTSSSLKSCRLSTKIFLEKERLKKAGAGVPTLPPGNLSLYDPNEDALLQGTNNLNQRITSGASFTPLPATVIAETAPPGANLEETQHFLEHLDSDDNLPLNFAKPQNPATATVLGRAKLISDDAPGDIEHVILRLPDGFHYVEGQSLSVIPPGTDAKTGRNNKPRLYSIASTRYGDMLDGKTISLCVRRAEYYDPVTGVVDPTKKGVCSNFLCDVNPGDVVTVAGPVGKTMLLPKDPTQDVIMIATGTGIAPFRSFMHRLFMENTLARHMFGGVAWLVLGVPVSGGLLYKEEFDCMMKNGEFMSASA